MAVRAPAVLEQLPGLLPEAKGMDDVVQYLRCLTRPASGIGIWSSRREQEKGTLDIESRKQFIASTRRSAMKIFEMERRSGQLLPSMAYELATGAPLHVFACSLCEIDTVHSKPLRLLFQNANAQYEANEQERSLAKPGP